MAERLVAVARAPGPQDDPARRVVLCVDDSETNLKLLSGLLGKRGCTVRCAADGAEALRAAAADPPDLVLLDVVMTGMDGFETCERLKALPGCADVPVMFVTAVTDVAAKIRAFDAGAVDHLSKPFDPREVVARVQAQLALRRLGRELQSERRALAERNAELERVVAELQGALAHVRTLAGLLPICAFCKGIRDDQGYWHRVEAYLSAHSPAQFTHAICPRCLEERYPDVRPDPEPPGSGPAPAGR